MTSTVGKIHGLMQQLALVTATGVLLSACGESGRKAPSAGSRITDVAQVEGDAGTRTLTFPISIDKPLIVTTNYTVDTVDGTAIAGVDFVAISNATLVVPPGSRSAQVEVTILGDEDVEADETFRLRLTSTVGNPRTVHEATGTIINDDLQQNLALRATYEYDVLGRLTAIRYSNGRSVHYSYDAAGNVSSVTSPDG
jgi:YD repeat-containing protein